MLRKRLTSLLFVLPLLAGLCIAAYKLGPSPSGIVKEETTVAPVGSPAAPASTQVVSGQVFDLFGMYQTTVGKGNAAVSPAEFLNSLEARYLQRGYRRIEDFDPNRIVTMKRASRQGAREPLKFFQRDDGNGISNLSATGEDADLDANEIASEPYTFSTLVAPAAGGGTEWATYRIGVDRTKLGELDRLDNGDFPGNDPVDIPRPPGLRRVYALNSGTASLAIYKSSDKSDTALIRLYLDDMQRHGWQLDSGASSAANRVASGVMCFNKGTRSCLVWVSPGKEPNTTTVTVSSH
jgi:hypothetical protein